MTLRALTRPMLDFLSHCVRARLNALISGGTGAGKTTLLNVLSSFIGDRERIVTIEDAAELQLHQEHVVRLETRPPNVEGKGAIRQRELMINALRMRPDRIVVGEVRAEEALDMLQAMNTGVEGSMSTVHANSPRDAFSRLEAMVLMADLDIPSRVILQQLASAIKMVVQVARLQDESAHQQAQLERAREVVSTLTSTDALRITLVVAQAPPQPQGKAIYVRDRSSLIFLASNMPVLPPQKAYELWLIPTNGAPIPAGLFKPDARGSATVVEPPLPAGVEAKTFAITVEPEQGSSSPTMPIVMMGAGE